jgi:NitT/TauT family transport system permease protein
VNEHDVCNPDEPSRARLAAARLWLVAGLVVVWRIVADIAGPTFVAPPERVAQFLWDMVRAGAAAEHGTATLRLASVGLVIGAVAGLSAAMALWLVPRLLAAVEPYVNGSAALPKYALMPVLIMWLGIGAAPKITLVVLLVFHPIFLTTLAGIRAVDARQLNMARVCEARAGRLLVWIVWPSMLPYLFAALRISVPRAIAATIIGELLVGSEGLGYVIQSSRQSFNTTGVFSGALVATLFVWVANQVVRLMERRVVFWQSVGRRVAL